MMHEKTKIVAEKYHSKLQYNPFYYFCDTYLDLLKEQNFTISRQSDKKGNHYIMIELNSKDGLFCHLSLYEFIWLEKFDLSGCHLTHQNKGRKYVEHGNLTLKLKEDPLSEAPLETIDPSFTKIKFEWVLGKITAYHTTEYKKNTSPSFFENHGPGQAIAKTQAMEESLKEAQTIFDKLQELADKCMKPSLVELSTINEQINQHSRHLEEQPLTLEELKELHRLNIKKISIIQFLEQFSPRNIHTRNYNLYKRQQNPDTLIHDSPQIKCLKKTVQCLEKRIITWEKIPKSLIEHNENMSQPINSSSSTTFKNSKKKHNKNAPSTNEVNLQLLNLNSLLSSAKEEQDWREASRMIAVMMVENWNNTALKTTLTNLDNNVKKKIKQYEDERLYLTSLLDNVSNAMRDTENLFNQLKMQIEVYSNLQEKLLASLDAQESKSLLLDNDEFNLENKLLNDLSTTASPLIKVIWLAEEAVTQLYIDDHVFPEDLQQRKKQIMLQKPMKMLQSIHSEYSFFIALAIDGNSLKMLQDLRECYPLIFSMTSEKLSKVYERFFQKINGEIDNESASMDYHKKLEMLDFFYETSPFFRLEFKNYYSKKIPDKNYTLLALALNNNKLDYVRAFIKCGISPLGCHYYLNGHPLNLFEISKKTHDKLSPETKQFLGELEKQFNGEAITPKQGLFKSLIFVPILLSLIIYYYYLKIKNDHQENFQEAAPLTTLGL